jgi:hypothetical protein
MPPAEGSIRAWEVAPRSAIGNAAATTISALFLITCVHMCLIPPFVDRDGSFEKCPTQLPGGRRRFKNGSDQDEELLYK